ncbi:MAG: cytidine 5'-phosphate N-acetylneuraminic acid synthetase [Candidatus Omnitrophica bacterium]|nr:cytidine 5'-phosphate N-acetylneuraminic acid synthetase [Candidatus Omnitrophota bacterium]
MSYENKILDCQIIIPAVKKNVAFADDLIKKLDGVMLIQRIMDKAKELVPLAQILVITDSEEISLICERNQIAFYYDKILKIDDHDFIGKLPKFFAEYASKENVLVFWPYAPLVPVNEFRRAYDFFKNQDCDGVVSVKGTRHEFVLNDKGGLKTEKDDQNFFVEIKAFMLFKAARVAQKQPMQWFPYLLEENWLEIKNYQDWWVCERLLQRKRIIFRVIGNNAMGMGHVYRALTLAHENSKDEIIFVCEKDSTDAVQKIAGHDYPIEVCAKGQIIKRIIALKPDLVINDILNTEAKYIKSLTKAGIKVVNFEDLGPGGESAHLVFNELFDEPLKPGAQYRWGHSYYFLRDEFIGAKKYIFRKKVQDILITFGGTDPGNLTFTVLNTVYAFCQKQKIRVHVVAGPGYEYVDVLRNFIEQNSFSGISFTNQTGVMSKVMERVDLAISSNGRTVYELAHMNIPSIIIAHHDREQTHKFACQDNGYIALGLYSKGKTEKKIIKSLHSLCADGHLRKQLWERMRPFHFLTNKLKVWREIERCLYGE